MKIPPNGVTAKLKFALSSGLLLLDKFQDSPTTQLIMKAQWCGWKSVGTHGCLKHQWFEKEPYFYGKIDGCWVLEQKRIHMDSKQTGVLQIFQNSVFQVHKTIRCNWRPLSLHNLSVPEGQWHCLICAIHLSLST